MPQQELLKRVVGVLEAAGVEYMVTGSYVSSLHGEPRSTHDIDIVVAMPLSAIPQLKLAFPSPEFYLDEVSMRDAIQNRDMFNLLHADTGDKVDFWMLKDDDFDFARFERRITEEIDGTPISVSTAEDTILMKLRWCNLSGESEAISRRPACL